MIEIYVVNSVFFYKSNSKYFPLKRMRFPIHIAVETPFKSLKKPKINTVGFLRYHNMENNPFSYFF